MNDRVARTVSGLGLALFLSTGCLSPSPQSYTHAAEREPTNTIVVNSAPIPMEMQSARAAPTRSARTAEEQAHMSMQTALAELQQGNARFVSGQPLHRNLPEEVHATAQHQYPIAAVVSCIDSRVPAEMVFDQGIGDLFNARVAGNVLNDDILGSLEFACKVSGAKLIVVMGHSNCGAIKGAIDGVQLGDLTALLAKIKVAEDKVPKSFDPRTSKNKKFVEAVAEQNVRLVMDQIRQRSVTLRDMLDTSAIGMIGGMYNLQTGEVRFIPQ